MSAAGQFTLTPGIGLEIVRQKFKSPDVEFSTDILSPGVQAEYGATDFLSVGGTFGYLASVTSADKCPSGYTCERTGTKGISDPSLYAKFRLHAGQGNFIAKLNYSFSIEDHKIESDGDSNAASGGNTLTASAGYEVGFNRNRIGFEIARDLMQTDRSVKDDGPPALDYKVGAGENTSFTGFYEIHVEKANVGGYLSYLIADKTEDNLSGSMQKNDDRYSIVKLQFYAAIHFDRFDLLPTAGYSVVNYASASNLDYMISQNVGCGFRFMF